MASIFCAAHRLDQRPGATLRRPSAGRLEDMSRFRPEASGVSGGKEASQASHTRKCCIRMYKMYYWVGPLVGGPFEANGKLEEAVSKR